MGVIGIWKRIPLLLLIGGSFITFMAVMTDNIIMGIKPSQSITSGSTTTYIMEDNLFQFTEWNKIMVSLMGAILMFVGAIFFSEDKKVMGDSNE